MRPGVGLNLVFGMPLLPAGSADCLSLVTVASGPLL
jgi:hypothetical protein